MLERKAKEGVFDPADWFALQDQRKDGTKKPDTAQEAERKSVEEHLPQEDPPLSLRKTRIF